MTFQEWWAGLGRSYDPETIWKAAQRAAVAEEQARCLAIIAGGDRPWQDIVAAIRARP